MENTADEMGLEYTGRLPKDKMRRYRGLPNADDAWNTHPTQWWLEGLGADNLDDCLYARRPPPTLEAGMVAHTS